MLLSSETRIRKLIICLHCITVIGYVAKPWLGGMLRIAERVSVPGQVQMWCHSLGLVKGQIVDISVAGVCIDIGPARLPVDASVALSFILEIDDAQQHHQAHAIVVCHDETGCRLMFDFMEEKTHQALRSLVGDWHLTPEPSRMAWAAEY